jgi:hypothetical protein
VPYGFAQDEFFIITSEQTLKLKARFAFQRNYIVEVLSLCIESENMRLKDHIILNPNIQERDEAII